MIARFSALFPFLVCAVCFYLFLSGGLFLHERYETQLPNLQRKQALVDAYLRFRVPEGDLTRNPLSKNRVSALAKVLTQVSVSINHRIQSKAELAEIANDLPFLQSSLLIISRKGKVRFKVGEQDYSSVFPKDWEKQLMMAIYRGGKVFDTKIPYFYPRPISHREFQEWEGQFTPLYHNKHMAFLYRNVDDYCWFYLLNLESISDKSINLRLSQALASSFGLDEIVANEVFLKAKRIRELDSIFWGYLNYLNSNPLPSIFYFITMLLLVFSGYLDKIVSRFSLKYGIFYFTVRSLLITVLIYLFYRLQYSHEIQLQVEWRSLLSKKVSQLETGQKSFEISRAKSLESVLSKSLTKAVKEFDDTLACVIHQDGTIDFAPENPPELFRVLMLQSAPTILYSQSHLIPIDPLEVKNSITKKYGETKVLGLTEFSDTKAIEKVFREDFRSTFYPFELSKTPFFLFWTRTIDRGKLSIRILMVQRKSMLTQYFKSSLPGLVQDSQMAAIVYRSQSEIEQNLEFIAGSNQEFSNQSIERLDNQGLIQSIHLENEKWFQMSQKSLRYRQYLYLFRIPERELLRELKEPAFWFRLFQVLSLVLGVFAWRFLTKSLTSPLKVIQERIQARSRGEDLGRLHLHRMDEYRFLVAAYNESRDADSIDQELESISRE